MGAKYTPPKPPPGPRRVEDHRDCRGSGDPCRRLPARNAALLTPGHVREFWPAISGDRDAEGFAVMFSTQHRLIASSCCSPGTLTQTASIPASWCAGRWLNAAAVILAHNRGSDPEPKQGR